MVMARGRGVLCVFTLCATAITTAASDYVCPDYDKIRQPSVAPASRGGDFSIDEIAGKPEMPVTGTTLI